jgi:hypothetical protein
VLLLEGWRQAADRAVDLLNGPLFKPLMFADRYLVKALETYLTKTLVFTWPAYYDMLPFPERWPALAPLFETTNWPQNFPRPHQKLLDQARLTQKQLCQSASPPAAGQEGHQAWHLLIGTGIETLTEVTLSEHQFHYRSSFDGDGMIAVESSAMEDAYFSKRFPGVCHTELMSDAAVVQTITDILAQRPL